MALMRMFSALAVVLVIGTSAHATSGMICRAAGERPIEAAIVISHTAVPSVVSARLLDGTRDVSVQVAQAWLEAGELRLDLVDPNALRHELRLHVRRSGRSYDGTLWRAGQRRWVRCRGGD
jgi:hypothetical protein